MCKGHAHRAWRDAYSNVPRPCLGIAPCTTLSNLLSCISMNDPLIEEPKPTLGDRLRWARERSPHTSHLSRTEFAELLGITRNGPVAYEHNVRQPLRMILRQWALVTGYPEEWIRTGVWPQDRTVTSSTAPDPKKRGRTRSPKTGSFSNLAA